MFVILLFICSCGSEPEKTDLFSLIGKDIRGEEIQAFLSQIQSEPEISRYDDPIIYFYSFKDKGISLRFTESDTLEAIFFYSEGADDFRQYKGLLPHGLSFTLNRNEIESILGVPEKSGGAEVINYWVTYPSKKIHIVYNTMQSTDMDARIYTISFFLPKDESSEMTSPEPALDTPTEIVMDCKEQAEDYFKNNLMLIAQFTIVFDEFDGTMERTQLNSMIEDYEVFSKKLKMIDANVCVKPGHELIIYGLDTFVEGLIGFQNKQAINQFRADIKEGRESFHLGLDQIFDLIEGRETPIPP